MDGLRGIAALVVVVGHFTATFSTYYPAAPTSSFQLQYGQFGVQLFFLISGFVILMTAERAKRASDFAISRLTRLYPAYWIAVVISILVGSLVNVPGTQLTPLETLLNFTMIQRLLLVPDVNGAFWTLAVEMQFYVIVFLVLAITKCRLSDALVRWLVAGWLGIAVISASAAEIMAPGVDIAAAPVLVRAMVNVTLAEYGPLFCLGMLLYMARRNGRFEWLTIPALVSATLCAYLLHAPTYALIVASIGLFFAVVALRPSTRLLRFPPLLWLGKISYSLYIVHVVVGYATIELVWPYVGRDVANLVALAVVTLLAWGLHALAEARLSPSWRRSWLRLRDRPRGRTP